MKTKRFDFRVTERRYDKLTLLAAQKERSVASLFDEWIDNLPDPKKQNGTQS